MEGPAELPTVSVVIPHYCQPEALALCLDSLRRQTLPADQFEIVVVDNNSPGGLGAVEQIVGSSAKLIVESAKGAGPARNRGAAQSRGEVLAFIDADCVASPQWLEEGLFGLDKFDIVGGRVDVSVDDEYAMTGVEAFERVFAFDFRSYIEEKGFTGSGNLFCRRDVFDAVGGFRPAVSEDKDWSMRATAMGYSLGYHDEAAIAHPARRDWRELTGKWARLNRESLKLAEDSPTGRLHWALRNLLVPLSIIPHSVKLVRSPKLPDLATKVRGLGTLAKIRWWRCLDGYRALRQTGRPQ